MKRKIRNICNICHQRDIPNVIWRGFHEEFVCDVCEQHGIGTCHIDRNTITPEEYEEWGEIESLTAIM